MSSIPVVQIRTTPSILHIDADPGQYSIRQPKAELQMQTQPSELTVRQHKPELTIDQSKAFEAYFGKSNSIDLNRTIYSGLQQQFLQNLENRVQQGDRMAAIHISGNTVAEIVGTDWKPIPFPEVRGPASYDNVDIHFETPAPEIQFRSAKSDLNVVVHKPEIEYQRGKLDIYVKQYASVQYTTPEINVVR